MDRNGENTVTLEEWLKTMWWLTASDGALPVGDAIYVGGALLLLFVRASSNKKGSSSKKTVASAPTYAPPPSTTYNYELLQAEKFAIRRQQAKVKAEVAVVPNTNNAQYYTAEIVSGQVVPVMPLTYPSAKLYALAGGNILCVNHAAAYALVKNIPSARWDGRHGCAESGYLNHYHLSSAHDNHIWYLGE